MPVTTPKFPPPPRSPQKRSAFTWLRLIPLYGRGHSRKVCEIDPLLCPYCGAALRIVAFILDLASLRRILGHLGFAPQPPEPLAHSPPAIRLGIQPDEMELDVANA